MKAEPKTESELLFEELCTGHHVQWVKLPRLQNTKQPDYELMLGEQRIVVEVKQINPNAEDKAYHDALERHGHASQLRNPDTVARRVRNHINESRPQLREYLNRHPETPTLLVLYDNARNQYTDSYTIQVALHGWEQVTFEVGGEAPAVVERGFGKRNNKTLRPNANDHLSALATIHECWEIESHERFLSMQFYHNHFAAVQFSPQWWLHPRLAHYALEEKVAGAFQNWARIDTPGGAE